MKKPKSKPIEKVNKETLESYCKRHSRKKVPKLIVGDVMEKMGVTYLQLADALGLAYPSNVSRLKTSQNLEFETLAKIAIALEVKVKDLIED